MGQVLAKSIGAGIIGVLVVICLALSGISLPQAWVIPGSILLGIIIGIVA